MELCRLRRLLRSVFDLKFNPISVPLLILHLFTRIPLARMSEVPRNPRYVVNDPGAAQWTAFTHTTRSVPVLAY